jgi:hypothetical protein
MVGCAFDNVISALSFKTGITNVVPLSASPFPYGEDMAFVPDKQRLPFPWIAQSSAIKFVA